MTQGNHTIVVESFDIDGLASAQLNISIGPGIYDDAHRLWAYTGAWNTWSGTGSYAGTLHYTDSPAAFASFAFTGIQFVLTYTGEFNRGSFEVWVDGALVTTINAYNPTTSWQRKYASPIYDAGVHTVVLKNISGRTDVDAIQVIATPDDARRP